jgi:hypothetical protein
MTSVSYYTSRTALWGTRRWLITGDRRMWSVGRKTPNLRIWIYGRFVAFWSMTAPPAFDAPDLTESRQGGHQAPRKSRSGKLPSPHAPPGKSPQGQDSAGRKYRPEAQLAMPEAGALILTTMTGTIQSRIVEAPARLPRDSEKGPI